MNDGITRKDFLNGAACAIGAALVAGRASAQDKGPDASARPALFERGIREGDPRYYPPALTGMRGSHPGSFEAGHMLRDGTRWDRPGAARDLKEEYDLIIVGAGISGLAAAHFFKKRHGPDARVLILDNHDDFGGHAKRNEFKVGERTLIGFGGTQSIEAIPEWGDVSMGLLKELGIDIKKFYTYFDQGFRKKWQLSDAAFFDKESFGSDKLVMQRVDGFGAEFTPEAMKRFVDAAPLAEQARKDLLDLYAGGKDHLPGMTKEAKIALLRHMSARDFMLKHLKLHPDVVKYLDSRIHGLRAVGSEAIDAFLFFLFVCPKLLSSMGVLGSSAFGSEPYIFHFPDGNASIVRMLVRSLIPGSAPGTTMEDIVNARMDYAKLDRSGSAVRLRLNSTVVRARNLGSPAAPMGTEVTYVRDGKPCRVRAKNTLLACWNMIIPYICPEMSQVQKENLAWNVKVPLVYGTIAIRNWKAFHKMGVAHIYAPSLYYSEIAIDYPVSMGGYSCSQSPDEPVLLHLVRTPRSPGLPMRDQYRAGRMELFTTPFETFEREARSQLDRMLGEGGFDSSRDVAGITINRWPHGYAYMPSPLWDPDVPEGQQPYEIGRKPFGRITIANADSGGMAESYVSINQAHRAVEEIMAMV